MRLAKRKFLFHLGQVKVNHVLASRCPIARSLDRVGDWWSMLILRDAFAGLSRFDQFEQSLGIAPNMLTRRLAALVKAGVLERRRYHEHPPRHEYILTERGRDFRPVLISLLAWGNKHFAREGVSMEIVDASTGARAEPVLLDRVSGRILTPEDFTFGPGPAADERTLGRLALIAQTRAKQSTAAAAPKRSRPTRS